MSQKRPLCPNIKLSIIMKLFLATCPQHSISIVMWWNKTISTMNIYVLVPPIALFTTYDVICPKPEVVVLLFLFSPIGGPIGPKYKKKSFNGATCPKFGPLHLVLKREWLGFWPFYFIKYISATQYLKFADIPSHSLGFIEEYLKRAPCPKKGPCVRKSKFRKSQNCVYSLVTT